MVGIHVNLVSRAWDGCAASRLLIVLKQVVRPKLDLLCHGLLLMLIVLVLLLH